MTRVLSSLKTVSPWQWLVLLVLFAAGTSGTYWGYQWVADSEDGALAEDQQLIPVQRDDLVTSISINGSLAFPNTETVSFETPGTLGELAVEEGQAVTAGQPLAVLDGATVAALQLSLAQTRLDASNAEEALAEVISPYELLEIDQAKAKVADAHETIRNTEEELLTLLQPTEDDLAEAESAIADAILKIDTIHDDIATLTSGPDQDELDDLHFQTQTAHVALDNVLRDQSLTVEDWNEKITDAEDDIATAVEEYRLPFEKWLGAEAQAVDDDIAPDALLKQWGADLEALFDRSEVDHRLISPTPNDDPSTAWNEQTIYAFTHLSPYDIRSSCDDPPDDPNVYCVLDEMSEAWDKLVELRSALDPLGAESATVLSKAQDAVVKAEQSLSDIADKIADLLVAPDPLALRTKDNELVQAKMALAQAESDLADLQERLALGVTLEVATAEPDAGEGIDTTMLDDDVSEPLRRDLLNMQKDVEDALLALREAEDSLSELTQAPDPLLVALRQAELDSAELEVYEATQHLSGVSLTSPITGIVTEISVQVGDDVNRNTSVLTLVDPNVIEVNGSVDEIDVLYVQIGATANVVMDALPGEVLLGTVSYVSADAVSQQGVVTYEVRIAVEAPAGVELRSGLTAVAELVLRSEPDVLLVPLEALRGSFAQPTVLVSEEGVVAERPITTGASDDFWVVVESGLSEGDLIVMEGVGDASNFGFGGFRGIPGGFGGGGFRPRGGGN